MRTWARKRDYRPEANRVPNCVSRLPPERQSGLSNTLENFQAAGDAVGIGLQPTREACQAAGLATAVPLPRRERRYDATGDYGVNGTKTATLAVVLASSPMMEEVRYQPGEAIRWLETAAHDIRRNAQRQGSSLVKRQGERSIGKDLKQFAGALTDLGRSALADYAHRQAQASEYVLHESNFEIVEGSRIKTMRYDEIESLHFRGDRASLVLAQGSVVIKPHAYIVSGRLKVPVGWTRNGIEVPYELLIDELAARAQVKIDRE